MKRSRVTVKSHTDTLVPGTSIPAASGQDGDGENALPVLASHTSRRHVLRSLLGAAAGLLGVGALVDRKSAVARAVTRDEHWSLRGNAGTGPTDFIGTRDLRPVTIRVNGAEVMRVAVTGAVGIGTTQPRSALHVRGRIATGKDFESAGAVTLYPPDGYAWFHVDNGPAGGRPTGRMRISYGVNPGDHEIMSFLQNSNVGVGTTRPTGRLHIASADGWTSPQLKITQAKVHDYARVRFETFGAPHDPDQPGPDTGPYPTWDLAVGEGNLHFFQEKLGNIMTLGAAGYVGIKTETPQAHLDVRGRARVQILEITGGADLAEPFDVIGESAIEPGTVMVVDEAHPGCVKISEDAYDHKVVGIVSGAAGLSPGLTLQDTAILRGGTPIALTGRVYCKADASVHPIRPGDALTTSHVRGCAMRVADRERAGGAILGKAMTALNEGQDLVLVLVNLQ